MCSTIGVYFGYIWPKMFFWTKEGIVAGWVNVWGDWAAHFSFANVFAYRNPVDWFSSHPLYLGRKFTYPFVTDFISGMLIRMNMDVVLSFILPSIVITAALLVILYVFYVKVLISPKQAYLAMLLFFMNGGLGFYYFFEDIKQKGIGSFLLFPPREYTHMIDKNILWINVVTSQLLPQRALLLGIPLTLFILLRVYTWWSTKFRHIKPIDIIVVGYFSSFLLLVHTHSLIALALTSFIFFLFDLKNWKRWILFAVSAAIPSFLIYQLMYGGAISQDFFKWYPGWIGANRIEDTTYLIFTFMNFGVFLPFSIFSILYLRWYKKPLVVSGVFLFLLSNLFLFQPNDWDNTKILLWSHLLLCIPVSRMLSKMSKKTMMMTFISGLLFISMTFSGFLDLLYITNTEKIQAVEWNSEDIKLAHDFREISNGTDIVLTSDQHNHWVSGLTGRQILMGYKGWMWTYGINYTLREEEIKKMYAGGEESKLLLSKYKIKWVVVGRPELNDYNANEMFFIKNYPMVLRNNYSTVYKIY